MFQFELFGEWRNRRLYGESLAAAVLAEKTLQRPDTPPAARGGEFTTGERVNVAEVIGYRNTGNSTRGDKKYISVLFKDDGGKVHDVDAAVTEIALSPPE